MVVVSKETKHPSHNRQVLIRGCTITGYSGSSKIFGFGTSQFLFREIMKPIMIL